MMHIEGGFALVHAGLLPEWTVARARELAAEVEAVLRSNDYRDLLGRMYGDQPARWNDALAGVDRLRVVINAMTRLRVCDAGGAMVLGFKGEPGDTHGELTPWFDVAGRRVVVFVSGANIDRARRAGLRA
jgi:bis(5'-nucleosyl)-tetraphosphatase (symmetrical)